MKGTNLGEFEEIVLLIVASLGEDAYGVSIRQSIKTECNRSVSLSTVHATLHRLEKKGYLHSQYGKEAVGERGGRPKLLFTITSDGKLAMNHIREMRGRLWSAIPHFVTGHEKP